MAGLLDIIQNALGGGGNDPWAGMREVSPMQPQPQQQAPQTQQPNRFAGMMPILHDVFTGLAMGRDNNEAFGRAAQMVSMGGRERREQQSQQQTANQTVGWLTQNGVGQQEAEFLARTPEALKSWYSAFSAGQKPDWQITEMYDDQGRKIKAMVDKRTGQYNPIGGAENEQTTLMQNIKAAGLQPGTPEYQKAMLEGSRSGVNVDARNMGSIPQGYRVNYDDKGNPVSMSPIPGGPEDTSRADAAKADNLSASTDVITGAANKARQAMNSAVLPVTGTLGRLAGALPETGAAEVRRQVETLKSNAKIENLQAMRAASPTGGALGAVSDSENAMLAAKAGALDPDSPNFARDLEDYERSLLRTIHGKEAGDRIFEGSRDTPAPDNGSNVGGYKIRKVR